MHKTPWALLLRLHLKLSCCLPCWTFVLFHCHLSMFYSSYDHWLYKSLKHFCVIFTTLRIRYWDELYLLHYWLAITNTTTCTAYRHSSNEMQFVMNWAGGSVVFRWRLTLMPCTGPRCLSFTLRCTAAALRFHFHYITFTNQVTSKVKWFVFQITLVTTVLMSLLLQLSTIELTTLVLHEGVTDEVGLRLFIL